MAAKKAPVKKVPVKKTPPAKDDSFGRFKKMYQGGEVKMLANPPPMPGPAKVATVVKIVSRAARDLRSTDPKSLRNEALRKANRAANQNKPKYKEKIGPKRPQGPEAPRYTEKIGPTRPAPSSSASAASSTGSKALKYGTVGLGTGILIGGGIGYLTSGSSKKASVSSTTGAGRPEYPSSNKGKSLGSSSTYSGYGDFKTPKGKSTYSGYGNFKTPKAKSSVASTAASTATTTAAASGSSGKSQAANVANAGGGSSSAAKRSMPRLQNKSQRESLAMEQRKTPSGNPKKSILSLFKKRK